MMEEKKAAGTPAPEEAPEGMEDVRREARRSFSRLGLGAFAILAVTVLLQVGLEACVTVAEPAWAEAPWAMWVLSFAPLYCVAIPLGLLVMRSVPAFPCPPGRLGAGRFVKLLPMCIFLMYAGNLVGVLATSLLSTVRGGEVVNPLEGFALNDGSLLLKILVLAILAPLLEEFVFRRALIDRMRVYGEKTAVVTSALMFGLFHGNLSQFFYAAALGALFGYVYVKTGRLRYSAALHMFVNALGSAVAPALLKNAGIEQLSGLDASALSKDPAALEQLLTPGMLAFVLYAVLLVLLAVLGLILLIISARRAEFEPAARELPEEGRFAVVWCNAGMLLLVLGCLAMIVMSVVS